MSESKLKMYREKRDFQKSPEPSGAIHLSTASDKPIFVVQKHDARKLHYDFRLEVQGVLKSWAVPKGPSMDPREKRLAVRTEDHPLDYANFEGVIPEGEYGGGAVLVWDRGTYENCTEENGKHQDMGKAIDEGFVAFRLRGEKIRGGYALKRFREENGKEQWLLTKMKDGEADARRNPVSTQPESVLTHRTLDEIAGKTGGDH